VPCIGPSAAAPGAVPERADEEGNQATGQEPEQADPDHDRRTSARRRGCPKLPAPPDGTHPVARHTGLRCAPSGIAK
jgi:hypothetical protein